ncbi:MAG: aldehyde ferredoxin oxidoreductase family protein [Candidatus Helarchaeota archaeon]
MNGLNHHLLRINLTTQEIVQEEVSDEIITDFLGGRGLGVKLLWDQVKAGIDPFSPENILIFTIGAMTGMPLPTTGRFSLITKSPLTNTIVHSNSGGFWGPEFKRCGYDALIIQGRLGKGERGYLVIDGATVEIKAAEGLWGLNTDQAVEELQRIEGKSQVLVIGPAGENLVRFASIMNQAHRAFGRGGVGAVMGSKNLKAIVVKNGAKRFQAANKEFLNTLNRVASDKIKVFPVTSQGLPLFGTPVMMKIINSFKMLPVRNNQEGFTDRINEISGETLRRRFFTHAEGCFSCPIRCGRMTSTGKLNGKGPEFESLWALGPQCGIFDLKIITEANYYCNKLGLDTISTGVTMACMLELQDKGILKASWNVEKNPEKLLELIQNIANRKGIGNELAEGSLRFAKRHNSEEYAMQVKGLEIPAYDPRGAMGQALNYATSNRGACHLTGYMIGMELLGIPKLIDRLTIAGKADQLVLKQNQSAVEDSLIVCKFVGFALGFDFQVRFLRAVTGLDFTIPELIEIGERIFTLERLFNGREGFSRQDDTLPRRFLMESLEGGRTVPLERMLEEYYQVRQWDDRGVPTSELLERLRLIN